MQSRRSLAGWVVVLGAAAAMSGRGAPEGDSVVRGQAGRSEAVLTTTRRLAGAIHSFKWGGREFIDSTDHGRQLQSACSFDNTPAAQAETFNPTEAGSRRDHIGPTSTSRLLEIFAEDRRLRTRTRMAFWLAPGERSEGQLARNTTVLSDYEVAKDVRIGFGRWPQVLDYRVTFSVPGTAKHKYAQFEALTGYMPADFERFWQFDSGTRKLGPVRDGPGEIGNPVVLATADGRFAMGIFVPPEPQPGTTGPGYGRWRFKAERVVKWNCVFRVRDAHGIRTGGYSYRMLVPFGTVADVEAMLREWTQPGARLD